MAPALAHRPPRSRERREKRFGGWASASAAAIDSDFVYIHDPDIKTERGESDTDKAHVPIDRAAFTRMARFGQSSTRATVLLSPRRKRRGG